MSNGRILRRPPTCVTDRSQPPLYTRQVSNKTTEALAKYLYDLESLEILRGIDEAYGDDTPEEEAEELRFLNHVGRLTIDALNASGDVWEADR